MSLVKLPSVDPIRLIANNKLHLVVDLDQTLVHCIKISGLSIETRKYVSEKVKNIKDMFMIMGDERLVMLRPGVVDFLEEASSMFDISVYTMGTAVYANSIVETLNNWLNKPIIDNVISREYCTTDKRKGLDVVMSRKDLVLIVDDNVHVWMEDDRSNVIAIKPYYYFGCPDKQDCFNDQELDRVLGVLREVHSRFFGSFDESGLEVEMRNVRQILWSVQMSWVGSDVTSYYHNLVPEASGCLKVKVDGDQTRLFTTTMTTSNGEEDDKKVMKKRAREVEDCAPIMLCYGKKCKLQAGVDLLPYTLS